MNTAQHLAPAFTAMAIWFAIILVFSLIFYIPKMKKWLKADKDRHETIKLIAENFHSMGGISIFTWTGVIIGMSLPMQNVEIFIKTLTGEAFRDVNLMGAVFAIVGTIFGTALGTWLSLDESKKKKKKELESQS
jgi:hypothetical protein